MKSYISIGDNVVKIEISYFGLERYYINDKLVKKHWSFKSSSRIELSVGTGKLKIDFNLKPECYFSRAYMNNILHADELFPEYLTSVESAQKRRLPLWAKKIISTLVIIAVGITVYSKWLQP